MKCTAAMPSASSTAATSSASCLHRIVAGDGIAAAMAAHVDAQHAEAGAEQRRHLLGPHAAIGGERMGDAEDGPGLGADKVVVDPASVQGKQHRKLLSAG